MTSLLISSESASGTCTRTSFKASRVAVFGESFNGWRIRRPLEITVEQSGDGYVVADQVFNVFGEGATWDAAKRDFVASLIDYCLHMRDAEDPASREVVRHLAFYVEPQP